MAKAKTVADAWRIELDEFHPDARVAAKYADHEARLFTQRNLKALVAKLSALNVLDPQQRAQLESAKYHLTVTEEAITEFNEQEDDT